MNKAKDSLGDTREFETRYRGVQLIMILTVVIACAATMILFDITIHDIIDTAVFWRD